MANAGTVTVEFAAEFAKLTAGMKQVDDRIKSMETGFNKFGSIAKGALGFLSVGAIASFAKSALDAADAVGDMADKIGTTASQLSRLQYAAQQSDIEVESFNQALVKFSVNISKADDGAAGAQKAFNLLGVSASQLQGIPLSDQLGKIADAFVNIQSPADKVAVAVQLFGKAGADLVPLLSRGSAGVRELTAEADRLGITLDDRATKSIDRASKALDRFFGSIKTGTSNRIGGIVADIFGSGDDLLDAEAKLDALIKRRDQFLQGIGGRANAGNAPGLTQLDLQIKEAEQEVNILKLKQLRLDAEKNINAELVARDRIKGIDEVSITGRASQIKPLNEFDKLDQQFSDQYTSEIQKKLAAENEAMSKQADDLSAILLRKQKEFFDARDDAYNTHLKYKTEIDRYEESREIEKQNNLNRIQQEGYQAAQALYTAFGGKYKKFAQALLAFEKAKAVANIIVDTQAAAASALETYGYPFGLAAAAGAIAFGAARIAAVVSTFIGGNSAPSLGGSSANPVYTNNANTAVPQDSLPTASQKSAVQVIFQGPVYNTADFQKSIVDALKDVSDRDVVVFSGNSAQAQVIRAA